MVGEKVWGVFIVCFYINSWGDLRNLRAYIFFRKIFSVGLVGIFEVRNCCRRFCGV